MKRYESLKGSVKFKFYKFYSGHQLRFKCIHLLKYTSQINIYPFLFLAESNMSSNLKNKKNIIIHILSQNNKFIFKC